MERLNSKIGLTTKTQLLSQIHFKFYHKRNKQKETDKKREREMERGKEAKPTSCGVTQSMKPDLSAFVLESTCGSYSTTWQNVQPRHCAAARRTLQLPLRAQIITVTDSPINSTVITCLPAPRAGEKAAASIVKGLSTWKGDQKLLYARRSLWLTDFNSIIDRMSALGSRGISV